MTKVIHGYDKYQLEYHQPAGCPGSGQAANFAPMISVDEARSTLLAHVSPNVAREYSLEEAPGRILASDIVAGVDVPGFDNSAMDGYAFAFREGLTRYQVAGVVRAGDWPEDPLPAGQAMRIFTGAPIPPGADTVLPQEAGRCLDGVLEFEPGVTSQGANVRTRSSQCPAGSRIASRGCECTPGMIALLASVGTTRLQLIAPPKAAVVATGNELCAPGLSLKPGQVYNSNGPAVSAYLRRAGISEIEQHLAPDSPESLHAMLDDCLKRCDCLVITGGISVGDADYVRETLQNLGVECLFYKVRQKPGKPLFVGKLENKWVFALPGNPAAVLSCLNLYAVPVLRGVMGFPHAFPQVPKFPLAQDWEKKSGLTHFAKAEVREGSVHILGGQASFDLLAFQRANCFVEFEENAEFFPAGTLVPCHPW
ncbi:MAG: molybdopterin molybdotransferase MoeA [Saprospiraceae bacterium]|nr:molybdopterin molybdotransferase MoeA [Saprospiraceae bacterium]MBP9209307.1 molybdopterin molybdotransferase MoeA [Saprospiraceae bacterium]